MSYHNWSLVALPAGFCQAWRNSFLANSERLREFNVSILSFIVDMSEYWVIGWVTQSPYTRAKIFCHSWFYIHYYSPSKCTYFLLPISTRVTDWRVCCWPITLLKSSNVWVWRQYWDDVFVTSWRDRSLTEQESRQIVNPLDSDTDIGFDFLSDKSARMTNRGLTAACG